MVSCMSVAGRVSKVSLKSWDRYTTAVVTYESEMEAKTATEMDVYYNAKKTPLAVSLYGVHHPRDKVSKETNKSMAVPEEDSDA